MMDIGGSRYIGQQPYIPQSDAQNGAAQAVPQLPQGGTPPQGDGQFSSQVAGTQPQPQRDLQFAEMANDSYDLPDSTTHAIGTKSEADLKAAGWTRLQAAPGDHPDHMVDANGNRINIDPASLDDPSTGFRAAIYQNPQGQYVVAYAGTNPKEFADIKADAGQAFGLETKQYNQAIQLAKKAEVEFGEGNVAFTGHSLGGGLASAAALATNASAVTFNSAGLSNETLRSLDLNPNAARSDVADSGQVRRYVVESDPLTLAQQDLPVVPILNMSPPNAVGHELRVNLPSGFTPIIGAHGGSGDNTSYVEALRTQTAHEPNDPGLVLNTVQNLGEFSFNSLGTTIGGVKDVVTDAVNGGKQIAGDIANTIQTDFANGKVVAGTANLVGDVANGVLDTGGKLVSDTLSTAGKEVRNATDTVGQEIRDAGKAIGLEKPAGFIAGLVEGGGNLLSTGVDKVGDFVAWGTDKLGDGVQWTADKLGGAAQWLGEKTVDGAKWVGEKTVEGAQWVGEKTVEGAQWVGQKTVEGAQWVGGKIADGASWVGDKVSKAMPWNW